MYTQARINTIARRYHDLNSLANQCAQAHQDKHRGRHPNNVQLQEDGSIEFERNTACSCHPEYTTSAISAEEFAQYLGINTEPVVTRNQTVHLDE